MAGDERASGLSNTYSNFVAGGCIIGSVNKFDPSGFMRMMTRAEAESRTPADDDTPVAFFPIGHQPLVQIDIIYGRALAYTRYYGLVEWIEGNDYKCEWIEAPRIKRVGAEAWEGSRWL